ncbi:low-density lipoprotein receptor-related protein 10 [Gadus macrocephalus]|uniref:low-density lipoprotein receptor-related protein 10 n=1 Tax=Gadus macrocephalus TaxID=80720 RepID=UPI0028CB7AB4|nr:low-density lipoprotein receptor-related protein 10 [Gadus macrocephalus]
MSVSYNLCNLIVLCLIAGSNFKPASSSARCGHAPQILDGKQGDITSSSYHNWSYRFGSIYDCWIIQGNEDEPIILSFSQFSTRCKKEWVSLNSSSSGREPVVLCGPTLPDPIEFPGGNVTVVHHFLPHLFPVSSFLLSYSRDSAECPPASFECASGRCLPLSWRCNGRVECLGEGLGADERGCDGEEEEEEEEEKDAKRTTTAGMTTSPGRSRGPPTRPPAGSPTPPGPPPPSAAEDWPCGGVLQTFYGTFAPPFNRGASMVCVWTVDPQDPRPLKLDLQQLELGPRDRLAIYNRQEGSGEVIKIVTSSSNYKSVQVESRTGLLSLSYHAAAGSPGRGFNATFRVGGYCPPWEQRCGGSAGGCFTREQRCDGRWDCPETGRDEAGCRGCGREQFACGGGAGQRTAVPVSVAGRMMGRPVCYPAGERCNYQLYCADGSDERDCTVCQPGTFHCDSDRCVFESWRCDGQVDCKDGTDELNCTVVLPRKVITAATVGSLVCGLLLVIAMACTCKLYSLRTREYSMFAPISRQEAELIQQQAPPSYGQLIAQGVIPPVEDFPTENPNEATSLSLRGILQLLRQDTAASPRRRRRPRFVRRAVRRLRRWGFLPRTPSRPAHAAGSASSGQPPQADGSSSSAAGAPPPASTTGVSLAVEAVNQPVPHKLGLLAQATPTSPAQADSPMFSAPSPPPPPYAPPAPDAEAPRTPPRGGQGPAPAPSSPSLASIFQSLGQRISLFRPSPSFSSSFSSSNSMPLSASPSFSTTSCSSSSTSDDEVLLIPLAEDAVSEDDVPMLT